MGGLLYFGSRSVRMAQTVDGFWRPFHRASDANKAATQAIVAMPNKATTHRDGDTGLEFCACEISPLEPAELASAYPRESRSRDKTFCEKPEDAENLEHVAEIIGVRLSRFSGVPGNQNVIHSVSRIEGSLILGEGEDGTQH
jgi:hypothetical protein